MRKIITACFFALILISCGSKKQYMVQSMSAEYIAVSETQEPDKKTQKFVDRYKYELDKEMSKVLAQSAQDMPTGRNQSLLTNFTSDLMSKLDKSHTNNIDVDLAIVNVRGLRAPIPNGDVIVGNIFATYPFDNALVVVRLKGKYLVEVLESSLKAGTAGLSSNINLSIRDNKLENVKLNGEKIDDEKLYTIITLDYLAEGNDGMFSFSKSESVEQTGILLRDYMLENIAKMGEQNIKITAKLDQRVTVIQ